ncbi:MAG: RluA family pseudouridine synthase [Flavobacteriales bacterium]|nr:RluA family pseudouridine synthase [Flavobacteriales bacterium]
MSLELNVLFEDDEHLVVLKPAGMATHGQGPATLQKLLLRLGRESTSQHDMLQPVHRLDFGTRGPVMVAKTPSALKALQGNWPTATKIYHAWMSGALETARGKARFALDGKPSSTAFVCLGHRSWGVHGSASLVEWRLETGRTHQIRRHAAALGHPVVGDLVYGPRPVYTGHGIHLTCTRLEWDHPVTGSRLHVEVEPAKKMRRVLPHSFHALTPSPHLHFFEPR